MQMVPADILTHCNFRNRFRVCELRIDSFYLNTVLT